MPAVGYAVAVTTRCAIRTPNRQYTARNLSRVRWLRKPD